MKIHYEVISACKAVVNLVAIMINIIHAEKAIGSEIYIPANFSFFQQEFMFFQFPGLQDWEEQFHFLFTDVHKLVQKRSESFIANCNGMLSYNFRVFISRLVFHYQPVL